MPALIDILPEVKVKTGSQRLLKPRTQPIPLLPAELARYYSHVHTAQLCVYYYLRSGHLIANPLQTLLEDVLPLAVSQAVFCAICLPRAGNWSSGTHDGELPQGPTAATGKRIASGAVTGTPKKRPGTGISGRGTTNTSRDSGGSLQSRILPAILALLLAILLPPVPLMALALILGAPLYPTSLLPHTLALSVHVSLLSTTPIFYAHGVSSLAWREVTAAWLPFDEVGVWPGAVGAVVGAWFGAIPMALDWDRDWQRWPCTVLWGSVIGWALGRIIVGGLKLGIGKRIDLSVPENLPATSREATTEERKRL